MNEKPTEAARKAATRLMAYSDPTEQRNAIIRSLLEFYDAGASASLARIERLEGLLRRAVLRPLNDDRFRDEISEALRHE